VNLGLLVRPLTSPPIGEHLADYVSHEFRGALTLGHAKLGVLVVTETEIEFGYVAPQVLLRNLVIRPGDAAFQDRKIILDRVGVMKPPRRTYSSIE
jgi:hypothetical protein